MGGGLGQDLRATTGVAATACFPRAGRAFGPDRTRRATLPILRKQIHRLAEGDRSKKRSILYDSTHDGWMKATT